MFRSFVMGGYECATGINCHGAPIDQVAATQHDIQFEADYRLLRDVGIRTAREGVRWPVIDRKGRYDFSSLKAVLEAANRTEIEVLFDLFHYGYPSDLDPFSGEFVKRFADYCFSVAIYISARMDGNLTFTPVNEPSYFAWAAADACRFAPHCSGRSFELKTWLVRAAIAGIEAIWAACPGARILNVDPVCRAVPPREDPDLADVAHQFNENAVFQAWDMIAGRLLPELGGSPRHLDIVGLNYYWTNQWEFGREDSFLSETDERCWPLRDLIRWVWHRYGAEMVLSETSHIGDRRGPWLTSVVGEVEAVLNEGIPLRGICLYPILGMPEWHAQDEWARMGLWDLRQVGSRLDRQVNLPTFEALKDAQARLEHLDLPRTFTQDSSEYPRRIRRSQARD